MNKIKTLGLGALVVIATLPLINNIPAQAGFAFPDFLISQNNQKPDVKLNLSLAKQTIRKDQEGREIVTWLDLGNNAQVQPTDILRYTVTAQNVSPRGAKNLVVTQPIPRGTAYILNSTTNGNGAEITYSIDGGRNFVVQPMVQVKLPDGKTEMKPAPAEKYTHIRWKFVNEIPGKSSLRTHYQVRVL